MTNGRSAPPNCSCLGIETARPATFPKARRILRRADFRKVYDNGFRASGPCFIAFCWRSPVDDGPKVGFTTPKALGKSNARNRMKRRLRECLRRSLWRLAPGWWIVFNLRPPALTAPWAQLEGEVDRLLERCAR